MLIAGDDDQVDLSPGLLLEAELGNKWVALTTGLQVQSWSGGWAWEAPDSGTDVIYTLGGRVHGAIGAGALAALYLVVLIAVASDAAAAGTDPRREGAPPAGGAPRRVEVSSRP